MSLAENFLSTARQLLLATENLKRLDERVNRLSDDVSGLNHRLIRVEALIEFSKSAAPQTRQPNAIASPLRQILSRLREPGKARQPGPAQTSESGAN